MDVNLSLVGSSCAVPDFDDTNLSYYKLHKVLAFIKQSQQGFIYAYERWKKALSGHAMTFLNLERARANFYPHNQFFFGKNERNETTTSKQKVGVDQVSSGEQSTCHTA